MRFWLSLRDFSFLFFKNCWEKCFNDKNSTCSLKKKIQTITKHLRVESKSLPFSLCPTSPYPIPLSRNTLDTSPASLSMHMQAQYLCIYILYCMCAYNLALFCFIIKNTPIQWEYFRRWYIRALRWKFVISEWCYTGSEIESHTWLLIELVFKVFPILTFLNMFFIKKFFPRFLEKWK